ncbi:MAG: KH domain-containing protein [Candidatus Moranbacteria bacterium]|nr:KH domain-containing protein [Candidatus Moranbacteria bacterium]
MTEERTTDAEFIEQVVKMLVDNPDAVKVERKVDEMGVLISLDVAPEDMGMVIGREGQTAKALRTLLRVIGARNNARVNLKINEPEGSERARREDKSAGSREAKSIDEVVEDINNL